MAPKFHELSICKVDQLTEDSVAIAFDIPEALRDEFAFEPGQYLTLRATIGGADVRRSYSISSAVGAPFLTFGVRHVTDGVFSSFANSSLQSGDSLQVMTPQGRFVARPKSLHLLLLAAGSGITPMMSLAASMLASDGSATVTLVYGNRQTDSIMYRGALEMLKDRYMQRLTVIHLLSREEQDVPLLNGRLDGEKLATLCRVGAIDPAAMDGVFLCGPGEMIDELSAELTKQGVAKDKIKFEKFTPADGQAPRVVASDRAKAVAENGATVEVILDGTRKRFTLLEAGETVLEAAKRQGLDLPFSCKGGMCCTCRCKIVQGSAEMAVNYSLEKWETDAGFTLACQTRATSENLVLDFDAL